MEGIPFWVFTISLFLSLHATTSVKDEVKSSLIKFLSQLSNNNGLIDPSFGWNMSSDPCNGKWKGITCNNKSTLVKKIVLDDLNLTGTLDANSICTVQSVSVLSLANNSITGEIPLEIGNCKQLTHLYINSNEFEGNLDQPFSLLSNLKRLDISNNKFSGGLLDLARISGLLTFLAENNQFSGGIPDFDFSNLLQFNVSFNKFSGPVPDLKGRFQLNSLAGNPGLCGQPLLNACPPSPQPSKKKLKKISTEKALTYSGYMVIGLVVLLFVAFKLIKRNKNKEKPNVVKKRQVEETSKGTTSDSKIGTSGSEYSITSPESGLMSSSLVILMSPLVKELRFEDLLKAPAELLGRGRHGTLYKVILEGGKTVVVKRIKDWIISSEEFKERMVKVDQVKNLNALPVVAFYCSKQEKLLVYEFQHNGSLFRILHETKNGKPFDWESRLKVAASVADALAFMHEGLRRDAIAHGNLKSSNILFNENMDPCISEYGLMVVENKEIASLSEGSNESRSADNNFRRDIYAFGVILLELLTGKLVQNNGSELARWVHSVVREEWTSEVFDKSLIDEGVSEVRLLTLLQVALKCINPSPEARISMNQVAIMINSIKEEDERSIDSEA